MSNVLEFRWHWPFVRHHACARFMPVVVRMPDGRLGVIDHLKTDGRFGVRPVDAKGRFLPNTSQHWTPEQRAAVPEEQSLAYTDLVALRPGELPPWAA